MCCAATSDSANWRAGPRIGPAKDIFLLTLVLDSQRECLLHLALMKQQKLAPTLGGYLKDARELKGLSLRDVEDATGISNGYLSQLEGDKIGRPSPVWLHKLSELYGVAYERLMNLAGYPVPNAGDTSSYSGLPPRIGSITKREEDAVAEYLEFLRTKRKPGSRR